MIMFWKLQRRKSPAQLFPNTREAAAPGSKSPGCGYTRLDLWVPVKTVQQLDVLHVYTCAPSMGVLVTELIDLMHSEFRLEMEDERSPWWATWLAKDFHERRMARRKETNSETTTTLET